MTELNILDKEQLFIDIGGPKLLAYTNIYMPQGMKNGIKFGASRNKHHANIIQIVKNDENYSIIYIRLTKPKYQKGIPHSSKVTFEQTGTLEEIKEILNNSFLS